MRDSWKQAKFLFIDVADFNAFILTMDGFETISNKVVYELCQTRTFKRILILVLSQEVIVHTLTNYRFINVVKQAASILYCNILNVAAY